MNVAYLIYQLHSFVFPHDQNAVLQPFLSVMGLRSGWWAPIESAGISPQDQSAVIAAVCLCDGPEELLMGSD